MLRVVMAAVEGLSLCFPPYSLLTDPRIPILRVSVPRFDSQLLFSSSLGALF